MSQPTAPKPTPVPRPTPTKPIPATRPSEPKPVPNADPKKAKREFVPKAHLTDRPFRDLKSMLADGFYLEGK